MDMFLLNVLALVVLLQSLNICSPLFVSANFLFTSRADKNWFGWAWGAESTVSVVDRSPPLSYPSRPAAFGVEISSPILGYVIPLSSFTTECPATNVSDTHLSSSSNSGCPRLCIDGPHQPDPSESWIALAQRGKCEFVNKVREAQRLGARAVVVGGQDPEISGLPDTLVNMYSPEDSSDIKIASTFIKFSDYTELMSLISSSNTSHSSLKTLSLLITADYSAWEWYSPIITFIIILFLPSLLTFLTLFIHRIRAVRAAQRERAPEDVVRSLPWRVWTGTGWEKHEGNEPMSPNVDLEQGLPPSLPQPETVPTQESAPITLEEEVDPSTSAKPPPHDLPWFENQLDCAICLCEFVKGDKVRVLPCHHIFHMEEVDEWLIQRKKLCPVCKKDVTQSENTLASDDPQEGMPPPDSDDESLQSPPRSLLHWPFFSVRHADLAAPPPVLSSPEERERSNERTPLLDESRQPTAF